MEFSKGLEVSETAVMSLYCRCSEICTSLQKASPVPNPYPNPFSSLNKRSQESLRYRYFHIHENALLRVISCLVLSCYSFEVPI